MNSEITIALAGNPNCGKTTLFNALTGSRQHVGNWPGVTVEKKEGKFKLGDRDVKVVDLPGTYSLGAYSEDEIVARDFILNDKPDVVINVIDSSNIERNLYLTVQLLETGSKVILALNMMDEAKDKDIKVNIDKLSKILNVPVISTVATKNHGIEEIKKKAVELGDKKEINSFKIDYGKDAEDDFIIDKRYEFIGDLVESTVKRETVKVESTSDKIDKYITNKWLGIPIFAIIMFFMYQITMSFGDEFLGGLVEDGFAGLGNWASKSLESIGTPELIKSFIVDGLIGGLGEVLVFIPMIFTMYLLISILEDSGYMARAAYVMDRLMNSIGLHGKTAVSLIIGSGCNVAGIMSTRTLESKKDRMIAILITPFMSCGAKLPIYALFAGAFFSNKKVGIFNAAGVVVFSLYVLGIIVAILTGKFLSSKIFKEEESYFIMELPPYRIPTVKSIFIHMWEKAESFVKKAGTIILSTVIIVWTLSNLPVGVEPGSADSLIGIIGSFLAPIFKPAGFGNWQSAVALITGLAAKEAVVSTLGIVYGAAEGAGLTAVIQSVFTPLTSISFMVMTLLYCPCAAAIGAIKRETNSRKWALWAVIYTCAIGWVASVLVYQIGKLLGFS